jgi:cation:H+ antiporter
MAFTILMTLVSLGIILLSCYVFVNAVEQAGDKLNLHQGIIGSILAAVGTALPETIIPIMAILVTNTPASHEIGIGAIAGAPFMLGTLAFFVTGAAVIAYSALGKRTLAMSIDPGQLKKDLVFFLIIYGIAVLTTFIHHHSLVRGAIAVVLMLSYTYYLKLTISSECCANEECEPLYLSRMFKVRESLGWISVQLLIGLLLIVGGSHMFIGYVEELSFTLGVAPLILSIIITPIATELPEKMNSIIWVGRGKDTLAMGNITGAMVFQSCFPVVFGILFTPWNLSGSTMLSACLAFGSSLLVLLWITVFKKLNPYVLLVGGVLYAGFLVYVLT